MAAKKKTSKAATSIEDIVAKSHDGINKDLAQLQTGIRAHLGDIGEALSSKLSELEGLQESVKSKQDELTELYGVEKALQNLDELKDDLEDSKREHERQLKVMLQQMSDKEADQNRQLKKMIEEDAAKREDEERARKIAREDEDRVRELAFEKRTREQDERERELARLSMELGSFEERLKTEVEKRAGSIKRELEFRHASTMSDLRAETKILTDRYQGAEADKSALTQRIASMEKALESAQAQLSAIATSALDKESGKAALDELRQVAHKQAESKK